MDETDHHALMNAVSTTETLFLLLKENKNSTNFTSAQIHQYFVPLVQSILTSRGFGWRIHCSAV